ncbi:MAG: T9SS C-terminal target domain-containing protein [Haliscomenobacteraceae bacterium CHB4]|nr:T9SS C-terminal target domain-containing protein [Haliscomenobacteraceae bacterium CHB4]
MKFMTAHPPISGRPLVCLLLAFLLSLALHSQCPSYPRRIDECFVCVDGDAQLEFQQRAFIHNPVRFNFGAFPADITLTIDFADGLGPVTVAPSTIRTVTYPTSSTPTQYSLAWTTLRPNGAGATGTQTIQTNFNTGINYSDYLPHESLSNLNGNTYSPPAGNAYPPGSPFNSPTSAGGMVHVLYANPDHQLRKPFILVEGFDPVINTPAEYAVNNTDGVLMGYGTFRWDVLMTGRSEFFDDDPANPGIPHTPQFALLPELVAQLQSRDYDLVYVDFANGGNYIQANANFLIEVLEWVNATKIGTEQSVLLGASMGGIVGRYALAKMEQEGKSHCVGLFGTFDTPHNGANIPLSVQALGWFYHATGNSEEIWAALNTPAARQQIIQSLGDKLQSGEVEIRNQDGWPYITPLSFDELLDYNYAALRNTLQGELTGLGWPKLPRKIAMLDGMMDGTALSNQGFGPGGKFYDASIYANSLDFGTVFKVFMRSVNSSAWENYTIHGMDNCQKQSNICYTHNALFSIAQPHDFNPCFGNKVPFKYHSIDLNTVADLPHLDNAPGGFRLDITSLDAQLRASVPDNATFNNPVKLPIMSFVPTWSSLAMATPLNNANLFVDLTTPEFEELNLPNAKVPNFDNFYAPPGNLRHVELDGGMIGFLMGELDNLDAGQITGSTLAETYNFGLRRTQIPNISVLSGGKLNINNTGPTGYVQSNPGEPAIKPTFTTYLLDCGQVVTVEAGGEFNIGAFDKSQHGITEVWQDATVHIKSGGKLHITSDGSALIIKPGATLILDPGAIVVLESPGSNIHIEGTLVWNGDINFTGLGYFEFAWGNTLELGPNADALRLSGAGKTNRFIRIGDGATLSIPNGRGLDLEEGAVEHHGAEIQLGEGSWCDLREVKMHGSGVTGLFGQQVGDISIQDCTFDGLIFPIDILGSDNAGFIFGPGTLVKGSDFHNYETGAHFRERIGVVFEDCQFTGNPGTFQQRGIFSEFNFITLVRSCTISDHDADVLNASNNGVDPLFEPQAGMGIRVEGGWILWMDGGEINNCEIGIGNQVLDPSNGAPTNIYMNHFATIRGSHSGIVMNGDASTGLVMMDCARILEIERSGIYGEDISLVIDPLLLLQMSGGTNIVDPNVFTRAYVQGPGNKYLNICYIDKTSPQPVPAKLNFWGTVTGGATSNDANPNASISLKKSAPGGLPCSASFPADVSLALQEEPLGCARELDSQDPDECDAEVFPGEPTTVREAFRTGINQINNEEYESAHGTFGSIAGLWQDDLSGFTNYCETLIDASKSLSEGESRSQAIVKSAAGSCIFPNPTSGEVSISLPGEVCHLRIWDTFGKLVRETSAAGLYRMDVSAWPVGLYWIDVTAPDGTQREQMKMVVQR